MAEYFRDRQEVADYLKVSRMTIHRWEKTERLNTPIGWGHTRSISKTRVFEWLKTIRDKGNIRGFHRYDNQRVT